MAYFGHVFLPAKDQLLFELRALAPPPSDAVAYRRMLATYNYADFVLHNFFAAANRRQIRRVKALTRKVDRSLRRLNTRAAAIGLKTCAKP